MHTGEMTLTVHARAGLAGAIIGLVWLVAIPNHAAAVGPPHVIEMLNTHQGQMMAFSQPLMRVKVGATVVWKATDKTHSVRFVARAVPQGIKPLRGVFNEDAQYTFETPGVYVYKCPAHYGMGMIGLVIVGEDLHNLEAVKAIKLLPAAQKRLDILLASLSGKRPTATASDAPPR